jgi:hypothetical protein
MLRTMRQETHRLIRQRAANMRFYHGEQRLAWKTGHVHHATAEDHRIGVEQVDAGGDGAGGVVQEGLYKRFLSGVQKQFTKRIAARLLFIPAFERDAGTDGFQTTGITATADERVVALRDMAQLSCHAVRTCPRPAVQPDGEAHAGAEISRQHLLSLQTIFLHVK